MSDDAYTAFPACLCTAKYEYIGAELEKVQKRFQRVSARLNMNMHRAAIPDRRCGFPACLCTAKYEYAI